ncbi:MAG: hypothetical protein JOZ52_06400 [Acidobacteria bacterium]|nr:hypothetical protein [Acidobacteriota bacterium]
MSENLSASVRAYLEEQSAVVRSGVYWNCLTAAMKLCELLFAEGASPWIARVRKTETVNGEPFHFPLIPRGTEVKRAWTTHYVCCSEGFAQEPLAGAPVELESYALEVFGEEIELEVFLTAEELEAELKKRS